MPANANNFSSAWLCSATSSPARSTPLGEVTQVVQFPASALIFREGEAGDCAYVVVRGSVQVFAIDRNGDEVVLAQLKELDQVGEQSLLSGHSGCRNASVRACEDTTLLRIPKAEFQKILVQRQTLSDLLSATGQQQVRANAIRTTRLARIWALFMFVNGFISIGILCGAGDALPDAVHFPLAWGHGVSGILHAHDSGGEPTQHTVRSRHCPYLRIRSAVGDRLQHAGPAIVTEFGWARILAAALSLPTTGALMIRLNVPHPPAAATTLMVSLGLVSRPDYLAVLEAGVALLVVQAIIINRLTGVRYPLWASVPAPKIDALASRGALQRFARLL